jgi:hypothetical protein
VRRCSTSLTRELLWSIATPSPLKSPNTSKRIGSALPPDIRLLFAIWLSAPW